MTTQTSEYTNYIKDQQILESLHSEIAQRELLVKDILTKYLIQKEVLNLLNISLKELRDKVKQNEIRSLIYKRQYFYNKADVDYILQKQRDQQF